MRSEYPLKNSRPNPYAARLGAKGRAELLEWWSKVTNVRVLPDDVAQEFPDTKTTVEALRLVMKLRAKSDTRTVRTKTKARRASKSRRVR